MFSHIRHKTGQRRASRLRQPHQAKVMVVDRDLAYRSLLRDGLIYLAIGFFALTFLSMAHAKAPDAADDTLASLADRLQWAVVNISTSQKVKRTARDQLRKMPKSWLFDKFFKDQYEKNRNQKEFKRISSLGSGFVIDPSGLIVTNNHVIKGADEIFINFVDGSKLKVEKVIGIDEKTDLALLKVNPKTPLKAVPFGSSDKARVGDWVMAIGNPFGLGGTVTVGIVSAKNRDINSGPYDEFIQTDAAINRGNSGGPLFNMRGEVIGVNTAIISPSGGSIGIGFSVPSDTVVNVIEQLQKYGKTRRGWLGVFIQKVTPELAESFGLDKAEGALVSKVTKDGPAEAAGLRVSDIILEFDGHKVKSSRFLPKIVALTPVDKDVAVKVFREWAVATLSVKIARLEEAEKKNVNLQKDLKIDEPETLDFMGMTLSKMTEELRKKYRIDKATRGVVITAVEAGSPAHENGIRAGFVILEVKQEPVFAPADVVEKFESVSKSNKENALLFLDKGNGEAGFVALPSKPQG